MDILAMPMAVISQMIEVLEDEVRARRRAQRRR
jgi:hypothetical protein